MTEDTDIEVALSEGKATLKSRMITSSVSSYFKCDYKGKKDKKLAVSGSQLIGILPVMSAEIVEVNVYNDFITFQTNDFIYEIPRNEEDKK